MSGILLDSMVSITSAKRALDEADTSAPLVRKTMKALPPQAVNVERAVIGSVENVRGSMLAALDQARPEDLPTLFAVRDFTPAEVDTLTDAWEVSQADQQRRSAADAPDVPAQRPTFSPASLSDISALLSAIAALNLARTVGAQMQGKFAELAYAAAVAQGAATISSARQEMNAAITGGVFAVGLASAGAMASFKGQQLQRDSVQNNLVEAHTLKTQAADLRATLDSPSARIPGVGMPPATVQSPKSKLNASKADKADKAPLDLEPRAELATPADNVRQAERRVDAADRQVDVDVADDNRLLTPDERAVLGEPIRVMEDKIGTLQLNHELNRQQIDKYLTSGQAVMALAQIISNATSSIVRVQAAVELANSTIRGAEAGVHRSMSEGQVQLLGETTSLINKVTEAADKRQRDRSDFVATVAGMRA